MRTFSGKRSTLALAIAGIWPQPLISIVQLATPLM